MLVNKFQWVSSKNASRELLEELNRKMSDFYSGISSRKVYQKVIDGAHEGNNDPTNILAGLVAEYIIKNKLQNVLEIGCGSGKIYQALKTANYIPRYTGVEMSAEVIENNKKVYPEASWEVGSVYDKCDGKLGFDCCLAFFVLEHLIYPEEALNKMLGTLKKGGHLILVFPDFASSGIFPSQKIGWDAEKDTKAKLKEFKLIDAVIGYYEGRRMRTRLSEVNKHYGPFVININPFCLSEDCKKIIPDVDAVYISNKKEIEQWAHSLNHKAHFPFGTDGILNTQSLIVIEKNS